MRHDINALLRSAATLFSWPKQFNVLGVPVDWIVHFILAAFVFLLAVRFIARWKAAIAVLALIAAKEIIDIPVKLKVIRQTETITVTLDSLGDVAAGLLGLGAALALAHLLGERWRAAAPASDVEPLRSPEQTEVSAGVSRIAFAAAAGAAAALVIGFELAGFFASRPALFWAPHVIAAALALGAYLLLGPANSLMILMPVLPFADWAQRQLANDKLHVGTTLILTLLCCHAVRRLRLGRRPRLSPPDWLVAAYAAYACVIVLVNCFRLGWTIGRAYWLIPPVIGAAAYFLGTSLLADAARLRRALTFLAAGFLAVAVIAVAEFALNPLQLEQVPGSAFGSAPRLSPYLSLVWPFLLAGVMIRGWKWRALCWSCVAVGAAAIVIVYVRAGWAAAAAAVLLLAVIAAFRRDSVLGIAAVVAVVACVAATAWVFGHAERGPYGPLKSRHVCEVASIFGPRGYEHARRASIERGARLVRKSPILGETGQLVEALHYAHALTYGLPGDAARHARRRGCSSLRMDRRVPLLRPADLRRRRRRHHQRRGGGAPRPGLVGAGRHLLPAVPLVHPRSRLGIGGRRTHPSR
ncbi:MAG: hypothetical protein ABIF82_15160 [Planctomycetota bacterium]